MIETVVVCHYSACPIEYKPPWWLSELELVFTIRNSQLMQPQQEEEI